jgi:Family of unknown function (DUF6527)
LDLVLRDVQLREAGHDAGSVGDLPTRAPGMVARRAGEEGGKLAGASAIEEHSMNQVSTILRRGTAQHFHWCPACERLHPLPDHGWTFNGDINKPTFVPSFKQEFVDLDRERDQPFRFVCHYIITDGNIQFCPDSWHGRSDIVAMPAIPPDRAEDFA